MLRLNHTDSSGSFGSHNKPWNMLHDCLARQLALGAFKASDFPANKVGLSTAFSMRPLIYQLPPLLCSTSVAVQRAIFVLLVEDIPAAQEDASMKAATTRLPARLDIDLKALIKQPPKKKGALSDPQELGVSAELSMYFLAWLLILKTLDYAVSAPTPAMMTRLTLSIVVQGEIGIFGRNPGSRLSSKPFGHDQRFVD